MTWAIFKISYDPKTKTAEGGICGSAFFVNKQVFISAHHCFNDSLYVPNKNYPKVKVFLINSRGRILSNFKIKKLIPEFDLAIGELAHADMNVEAYTLAKDFSIGDSVYNIGFPQDKSLIECKLRIEKNQLLVDKIVLKEFQQDGDVADITRLTVKANDINLDNKLMIKLSYTSRIGFSGGPCLLKSSDQVIGMMSMLIPPNVDPKKSAMAVRMSDILQFLDSQ